MSFKRKNLTTISTWAVAVLQTMETCGFDPEHVVSMAGLDRNLLSNPDARIRIEDMSRLWKIAVKMTNDECFGLRAAANIRPTTFHALGFAIMVSSSLMDAFERLRRFYRIVSDSVEVRFEYFKDTISFCFNPYDHMPQPSDEAFDMAMASIVLFARMLTNSELNPVKVDLRRKKPANPEKFIELFRSPVVFGAENNRIFFNIKDMQKPLPTANAEIARRNDQIVVEYLARFDKDLIAHKVHARLIDLLPLGEPSIDKLARSMGLSTRSLHRCLQKENVTYRYILNDIRKNLAAQYLKRPTLSIIEVAFQLGYSDSSNFTRAFKRWFGISPREYRKRIL
ncbi:MAG: AraC family transcriptional regulator [Deltaproteobacteria bacterium]|nr:AraC family transcriptional regulator [Deltaproteobacteria bacterium]